MDVSHVRIAPSSARGVGLNPIDSIRHSVRTTQQFSITLPNAMADAVKSKVAGGEYATESEVIRDGLRALLARDRAIDSWLHTRIGPVYEELKTNTLKTVSINDVKAALTQE